MINKILKFLFKHPCYGDNDMATFNVRNKTYTGNSIHMVGGRLIIDGVEVQNGFKESVLEIKIEGGIVMDIKSDLSINCGNVGGNVDAKGSVNCDDVVGNVTAGGSVNCDDVGGNIKAGGSVISG